MLVAELESWTHGMSLVAVVVTIVMVLFRWKQARARRDNRYPPMAPAGMWETIRALSSDDNPWFLWRTSQEMGSSVFRLPLPVWGTPMIAVVSDPKLARAILTDKHTIKPRQMYRAFDWGTNGVPSIFSSNGSFWHSRRKGVAPAFSSNQVQRMNSLALAKTDKWIEERLRPLIEEGKSFDVADEMIDLLLVAISETAFEYVISPQEVAMFKTELEIVLREFIHKANLNPFRRMFGFLIPEHRRAKLGAKRLQDLSLNIIRSYRKLANPLKGTIIDLICSNPCYKDDVERSADVGALLIGGHDTTAYSLAWALKELAQNPEIQDELRASIHGTKEGEAPNQLELVKNIIREAIRLHPVSAAGSARQIGRDFATKDGKLIPIGSIIFMPYFSMLRDPAAFGSDSESFNPSRWESSNVTPEMNEAYLPFAVGRQNCVGQPLANAELHCILPRIISQFDLSIEEEGTHAWFLTLKPAGTMLRAQPVNQA